MTTRDLMEALAAFDPACNVRVGESEVVGAKRCEPRVVGLETDGEKSTTVADLETELNDAEKQLSEIAIKLDTLVGEITKGALTPAQIVEEIHVIIP